eukprot:754821-Hanusia_phi.AAC.1
MKTTASFTRLVNAEAAKVRQEGRNEVVVVEEEEVEGGALMSRTRQSRQEEEVAWGGDSFIKPA